MGRRIKTLCLMLVWISMGMNIEITGPTLIDLKLRLNSTYNKVSKSVAGRGAGNFLGAVVGGVLVDKFGNWNELNVAAFQAAIGTAVLVLPLVKDTALLWIIFFINGACHGVTNVSGQRMILELWQEKAAAPMHVLHTGYGIGAIIVPLIANPFLAEVYNTTDVNTTSSYVTQSPLSNTSRDHIVIEKESRIQYAYLIVAVVNYCLVFPFLIFQISTYCEKTKTGEKYQEKKKTRSLKELVNPATYANGSFGYGLLMFILLFLYFLSLIGDSKMFANFVRSFSIDQLKFSKTTASYLNMGYWASFTIGRFVSFVTASYISMTYLFFTEVTLSLIAIAILFVFSTTGVIQFWVTVSALGFFLGPLTPSCIGYGNNKIEITGMCLMFLTLGAGLGEMAFIWVAGFFYDSHGPKSLLYILQIGGCLYFIVMLIMILSSKSRPNRFMVGKNVQNDVTTTETDPLIRPSNRMS